MPRAPHLAVGDRGAPQTAPQWFPWTHKADNSSTELLLPIDIYTNTYAAGGTVEGGVSGMELNTGLGTTGLAAGAGGTLRRRGSMLGPLREQADVGLNLAFLDSYFSEVIHLPDPTPHTHTHTLPTHTHTHHPGSRLRLNHSNRQWAQVFTSPLQHQTERPCGEAFHMMDITHVLPRERLASLLILLVLLSTFLFPRSFPTLLPLATTQQQDPD